MMHNFNTIVKNMLKKFTDCKCSLKIRNISFKLLKVKKFETKVKIDL